MRSRSTSRSNSANGCIYFARGGEIASNRVDDQEAAMLSLRLLQIWLCTSIRS